MTSEDETSQQILSEYNKTWGDQVLPAEFV
jgi:hypothetical protein